MDFSINFFQLAKFLLVTFLIAFTTVLGCGTLPQGEVTALRFTVDGFTVPAEMAYSEDAETQTRIPSIARSKDAANKFVGDLVMNAIDDVLQEQGRNALLLDAVISQILQQLSVTIDYTPIECKKATDDPANTKMPELMMMDGCFIIEGLVHSLCAEANKMCKVSTGAKLKPVPLEHRKFTGTVKTSNVIMANWSRQMWQSVMNRVFQRLVSNRFGKFFSTATLNINS